MHYRILYRMYKTRLASVQLQQQQQLT